MPTPSLTHAEREFLNQLGVPLSKVFNAAGRTVRACQESMSELGALVAVNTTPCQKGGHRIRTRSGHCVVCDTAKISYLRRHDEAGYVYIAVSKAGGLVKVGTTIDLTSREKNLNSYAYGEQKDWNIRHSRKCENSGHYEFLVQRALERFSVRGRYFREGRWQDCYELFSCSEKQALDAFNLNLPRVVAVSKR